MAFRQSVRSIVLVTSAVALTTFAAACAPTMEAPAEDKGPSTLPTYSEPPEVDHGDTHGGDTHGGGAHSENSTHGSADHEGESDTTHAKSECPADSTEPCAEHGHHPPMLETTEFAHTYGD